MHLSSTILRLKDTFTRQIRPLCTVLTIVNTSSKTYGHENRVSFPRKYFDWSSTQNEVLSSVTRLGDFLNFSATCFITKVAQMFVTFWPVVKSNAFYVKLVRLLLGQLLKKLGLLFISISGHTAHVSLVRKLLFNTWQFEIFWGCQLQPGGYSTNHFSCSLQSIRIGGIVAELLTLLVWDKSDQFVKEFQWYIHIDGI